MPWPTRAFVDSSVLTLSRDVDESGCIVAPWEIQSAGHVMSTTGTLMERHDNYDFVLELARGKVNQVRCQAADWQMGGLTMSEALTDKIRDTSRAFGRAAIGADSDGPISLAQQALASAYRDSDELVRMYIDQMFQARHQRQPRLETTLACRFGPGALTDPQAEAIIQSCNSACLTFDWKDVEVEEGTYRWEPFDAALDWAEKQGLALAAGPLVTFTRSRLPEWIWIWERDVSSVATFLCEYTEAVVRRYRNRIRTWQLCTASNCANVLGLGEDEMLWLTVRLAEAVKQVDPNLSLVVGVAQPWGEYMAAEDRTHSPFIFADTLIRSGLNLSALDIELVMGVSPDGSYCRDLLEASRLIDLYTLLGTPLRVTLGYPSSSAADALAAAGSAVDAGYCRGIYSPDAQADWINDYTALSLCKPSVRGVQWVHGSDAEPHQFPNCGLFDAEGKPKPAVQKLRALRENHLR
jgi:hypothetical protein